MHINVVPQIRLHLNAIGFSARLPWMKYDVLFTASNDLTYGLQEEVVNLNEQFSHLKSLVSILCLGLCGINFLFFLAAQRRKLSSCSKFLLGLFFCYDYFWLVTEKPE